MKSLNVYSFLFLLFCSNMALCSISIAPEHIGVKKKYLEIERSSLKKWYLLRTFSIQKDSTGTGRSNSAKVVYFEYSKLNNQVVLFEVSKGHAQTSSVDTKKLIAIFPVINKGSKKIRFDFQAGFNHLYTISTYQASDYISKDKPKDFKIERSLLLSLTKTNEIISIDQLVHFYEQEKLTSFQIKFVLNPYKPDSDFKKLKSTKVKKVGYFDNHPFTHKDHGNQSIYSQRLNINKSYTYHISNNTPANLRKAIREGVLYWNRYLPKKMLKVEELTEKVDPYQNNINLIQWIDHNYGYGARADMQVDPLTGEILQSIVYMSSAFSFNSTDRLKTFIDTYDLNNRKKTRKSIKRILKIKGFQVHHQHNEEKHFKNLTNDIISLTKDIDKSTLEKINQDIVRVTIAHEIGHTLGLRHNFAASTVTDYNNKNLETEFRDYLIKNVEPKKKTSNSVMDYLSTEESIILSKYIANEQNLLGYDNKAILWGYHEKDINELERLPFCSDYEANTGKFYDCRRFDHGKDPFKKHLRDFQSQIENMSYKFLHRFSRSKNGRDHVRHVDIENISLSLHGFVYFIDYSLANLMRFSVKEIRLKSIESHFERVSDFNRDEINEKTYNQVKNVLEESTLLEYLVSIFQAGRLTLKWKADYKRLKTNVKFFNLNNFTEREIKYIDNLAEEVFQKLERKVQETVINTLAKDSSTYSLIDPDKLEEAMSKIVSSVVFRDGQKEIKAKVNEKEVMIKKPFFSNQTRSNSLKLLSIRVHDLYHDFGKNQLEQIKKKYLEKHKKFLPHDKQDRRFQSFLDKQSDILPIQ